MAKKQSFERQIINNYKLAFRTLLNEEQMYFRTRDLYLSIYDKVFTTKNIIDVYHRNGQLKLTDIKFHIELYASLNNIDLKQFEHLKP